MAFPTSLATQALCDGVTEGPHGRPPCRDLGASKNVLGGYQETRGHLCAAAVWNKEALHVPGAAHHTRRGIEAGGGSGGPGLVCVCVFLLGLSWC